MSRRRTPVAFAAVAAALIPTAIGCMAQRSQGSQSPVTGVFFNRLRPTIKIDQVWCAWDSKNRFIDVHIRVRNTGPNTYTLRWQAGGDVQPETEVDDTAFFNRFLTTAVPAESTVTKDVAVPIPRDVKPGAALISCAPSLGARPSHPKSR